jgi:hypothetical protein
MSKRYVFSLSGKQRVKPDKRGTEKRGCGGGGERGGGQGSHIPGKRTGAN